MLKTGIERFLNVEELTAGQSDFKKVPNLKAKSPQYWYPAKPVLFCSRAAKQETKKEFTVGSTESELAEGEFLKIYLFWQW